MRKENLMVRVCIHFTTKAQRQSYKSNVVSILRLVSVPVAKLTGVTGMGTVPM